MVRSKWIPKRYLLVIELYVVQFNSSFTTNHYFSSAEYPFPEYHRDIANFVCKDRSELIQCQGKSYLQCVEKAKPLCDNDMNCFGISYNRRDYIQFKKTTTFKCTSKRLTSKFENGRVYDTRGSIMKKEKGREKLFLSIHVLCYMTNN